MAALTTMQSAGATAALAKAVQREAPHDKNANVRMPALQLLVQWLPSAPEISATIKQIAVSDESQIIRDTAQRALQPG